VKLKHLNNWVDRRWFAVSGEKHLAYIAFSPTFVAAFVSRDFWWVGAMATALLLTYFLRRGYRAGRNFMRPIDQARDDWASKHQSSEYRASKNRRS
jgi:hypothetical protein